MHSDPVGSPPIPLAQLARNQPATVVGVAWDQLSVPEAKRLREFGLDEGVEVELIRPSGWLGGPMAIRVGRMQVALRRHVGARIHVAPELSR